MQYHQIVIFFHRPWVSKSYIQPRSPRQGPGYHHARRMCIESATAVARLLHIYEKHYTFRRMNNQVVAIIFSAALMLLFVTVSSSPLMPSKPGEMNHPHPRNAEMVAYLNLCFRALDELGQSFENAKRTRDYLVTLQRRWQAHMRRSGPRAKRQMSSANLLSASSEKPSSMQPPHTGQGSDNSRKKSRLATTAPHFQPDPLRASTSITAPSTTNASYQPPETPSSHTNQPSYQPQSFAVPSSQPSDLDWIRNSDLHLLSENANATGTIPTPHFSDDVNALPDLEDPEAWWSSPNGNSRLGGSSL